MNKLLLGGLAVVVVAGVAYMATQKKPADIMPEGGAIKMGVILGFTGPIESLTPDMAAGAELAMAEASKSGNFMGGTMIEPVRGDSTCVDAAAATATAERLITRISPNAR